MVVWAAGMGVTRGGGMIGVGVEMLGREGNFFLLLPKRPQQKDLMVEVGAVIGVVGTGLLAGKAGPATGVMPAAPLCLR